jgi:Tfp pilus assembly protein PilN
MANLQVNLLKNKRTLTEKDYQRERNYLRLSLVAGISVGVVVVALTLWNFFMKQKLTTVQGEIAQAAAELQAFTQANAEQLYLKSRLGLITEFLDDQSLARQALQELFAIVIPGVNIGSMEFLDGYTVRIQLTALDVSAFNAAIDYFKQENSFFSQVVSRGVSQDSEQNYQLTLDLSIAKGS